MFTFKEYQSKTDETAIYKQSIDKLVADGDSTTWKLLCLAYVGLGLGEVGELQGKIKKIIRDKGGVIDREDLLKLEDELGDILWYVSQCCNELGLDMGNVAMRNINKLASRKERGVIKGEGDER
jgi:NTP pyrophosphatase (non-canonical NTP hydrolase)